MNEMIERSFTDLLEEIVDNRGRTCPTADSGLPLIATNCIKDDHLYPVFENVRYVDEETVGTWFRGHPRPNDIIFVCKGSPGRVAMVPDPVPFCIAQDMVALRADQRLVQARYLYYALKSPAVQAKINNMHVGSMIPHFKKGDFGKLRFSIHDDIGEQQAIAEVLGVLDDKIAANAKLAATAEALGKALFQNSISGPEAVSVQLREVAKNVPGKYLAKDDYVSDGPYFIYGSNSIMGRHDKALNQGRFAVLAKIGSYCGNLRWSQRPAWVNNNASAIVPAIGMAPSVLRHALDLIEMAPHKAGTGQPYIRMDSLFSSEITVPGLKTSAAIAPVLDGLSEVEARSGEENTTLATTRDALLHQLMSGTIRVKDAGKVLEVAGV